MQPWKVVTEIESDNSRLFKEAVVAREAAAGNEEFFRGCRLALDSMITFGLKQIPIKENADGPGLTWPTFALAAQAFIDRQITGNAAREVVHQMMNTATQEQWNDWYRRILIKDMKAGFTESTINRVCEKKFPQYAIPVFECQLARDCVDEAGNVDESELHGRKQVDTKLDGIRVLTIVYPDGRVDQFSRNGKELFNFTVIRDQIAAVADTFDEPTVLDAEVTSKSFQDLMKQARRKSNVQADDSVLNLIDIIPLTEFQKGKGTVSQEGRSQRLHAWFASVEDQLPNVSALGYEVVDLDTKQGQKRLYEINRAALAAKAEGIMLKDPAAVYECKRSGNWLKMKPFIEETLEVVAVEEGKPDSKFVGTMGALVLEGVVDGKAVRVNCGSGYSIQQRAQIWADYTGKPTTWEKKVGGKWVKFTEKPTGNQIVGQLAEVRADALTQAQGKDEWSMRFPRFKTFRGFAAGEKI